MSISKGELEKELEELDQRRDELQRKITEANPKVVKRSKWDGMTPLEQYNHVKNGGDVID